MSSTGVYARWFGYASRHAPDCMNLDRHRMASDVSFFLYYAVPQLSSVMLCVVCCVAHCRYRTTCVVPHCVVQLVLYRTVSYNVSCCAVSLASRFGWVGSKPHICSPHISRLQGSAKRTQLCHWRNTWRWRQWVFVMAVKRNCDWAGDRWAAVRWWWWNGVRWSGNTGVRW